MGGGEATSSGGPQAIKNNADKTGHRKKEIFEILSWMRGLSYPPPRELEDQVLKGVHIGLHGRYWIISCMLVQNIKQSSSTGKGAKWRIRRFINYSRELIKDQDLLEPMAKALDSLEKHGDKVVELCRTPPSPYLFWWLVLGEPVLGILAVVAMLVITCALGLGTRPAILIRSGGTLAGKISSAVLDKTGTITLSIAISLLLAAPLGAQEAFPDTIPDTVGNQIPNPVPPATQNPGSGSGQLAGSEVRSAAGLLRESIQRLNQRQYQAAFQAVDNYLLLYPEHYRTAEANFYRSIIIYHLGRIEEARNGFNAILSASPANARRFGAFYWLGLCAYRLGERESAYDIWLRQLAVREARAADYIQQTYFGLAQLMVERGDDETALGYFRLLNGHLKRRAGFAYGSLALKHGLYREAYNAFSTYLILQETEDGPGRPQALFYQGQAAFFAGLLSQARQSLDSVLRLYHSSERLFLAALIMRLRIAIKDGDSATAERFYNEATALEQRYRHGLGDWLNDTELPLFVLLGNYPLALKHMRGKKARSKGRTEREIARFNVAMVMALLDPRDATSRFRRLEKSFIPEIRERSLFHAARLQISFPLTRAQGLPDMERYLEQYPKGLYEKEAVRILLSIYRSDPDRFWLAASVLLEKQVQDRDWPPQERARFYLYWAEMARQLGNENVTLSYLHQSWKLAPRQLVGLQAYYRSGAIYFAQQKYVRALGYFREVQLQLSGQQFPSKLLRSEASELGFYAALGIAQSYAGAGQDREALRQFERLIQRSREDRLGRNLQQAQLQLGLVYFYREAYGQAVDTFDLIIAQGVFPGNQPDIPPDQYTPALMALYWKGEALFRQGLFAAARQSFRRVNEIFPEALGASAYLRAALAAKAAEDYHSVIEDLNQAQAMEGEGDLLQLLNIDFNLVKYNLLLGRDKAALAAAEHMLAAAPPAYDFLGEAFLEVAELYFNRGEPERSLELLELLRDKFIRGLPPRQSAADRHLELYLTEQSQNTSHSSTLLMDPALNANLRDQLFSFDAAQFLRRYGPKLHSIQPVPGNVGPVTSSNAAALEGNIDFYLESSAAQANDALSHSIFSALYLQGIIHAEQQDYLAACKSFLQYLKKDRQGAYAVSALSSVLRLIPELNVNQNRQLYAALRGAQLGDAIDSVLFARYWSFQPDNGTKKRALEKIIRQTLSLNARKEAMYHLAEYYRKRGDLKQAEQLLLDLRIIKGGNIALDPENYWAGLANLELGRTAYQEHRFEDAKAFLNAIIHQPQVERETLAEAYYWLAGIARFEGDTKAELSYRRNLQNQAPESEWLRKLN